MLPGFHTQFPENFLSHLPGTPFEPAPWRQFVNPLHKCVFARDVIHGEEQIQTLDADAPVDLWVDENSLQFGSKIDVRAATADVERFDSESVARQDQAVFQFRPKRNRKHSAQARERIGVPFKESMENNFGIGARKETVPQTL